MTSQLVVHASFTTLHHVQDPTVDANGWEILFVDVEANSLAEEQRLLEDNFVWLSILRSMDQWSGRLVHRTWNQCLIFIPIWLRQGPEQCFCKYGNEYSSTRKVSSFFTSWMSASFSRTLLHRVSNCSEWPYVLLCCVLSLDHNTFRNVQRRERLYEKQFRDVVWNTGPTGWFPLIPV